LSLSTLGAAELWRRRASGAGAFFVPRPTGEYYGIGFNFGGHSDYNIMKYVSVRMNVDYTIFSFDSKKFVDALAKKYNVQASDLKMEGLGINMFSFTMNGLGKIPTKTLVTPYGILDWDSTFSA